MTLFVHFAIFALFAATEPQSLLPIPSGQDLAKAEANVEAIFGAEIEAAKTAAGKKAVAEKMLATADAIPDDQAGRYAIYRAVRKLAIEADAAEIGVRAAEGLAEYQGARDPDVESDLDRGHRLWEAAEKLHGREQLAARLDAAEWYFRALPEATGLQRELVEKRLAELGWKPYLPLTRVRTLFGLDAKVWTIEDGVLSGRVGDVNRTGQGRLLTRANVRASQLTFEYEIRSPRAHLALLEVDGTQFWCSKGHWNNQGVMVARGSTPINADKGGDGVRAPREWHKVTTQFAHGKVRFLFDGNLLWEGEASGSGPFDLRPGIGGHQSTIAVRHVILLSTP